LFRALFDVQCFDLDAVASVGRNKNHMIITASTYANYYSKGSVVDNLDTVILGATEIDLDFNVNVVTGSTGVIIGASGGHSDTAAGSKLTIIVSNLTRKNVCVVREKVTTVTTPGETIDALVTEYGIAINPRRKDLLDAVKGSDISILDIAELKRIGEKKVGPQAPVDLTGRIVGIVQYRDGTVIDLVYQPKS
jgi:citrate lyase subunit alpha/citrate CoA-transferase